MVDRQGLGQGDSSPVGTVTHQGLGFHDTRLKRIDEPRRRSRGSCGTVSNCQVGRDVDVSLCLIVERSKRQGLSADKSRS